MKTIHSSLQLKIPDDITCTVNNRVVTIKGKRGVLRKSFKHTQLDVKMIGKKRCGNIDYDGWLFSHKCMTLWPARNPMIENFVE